MPLDNGEKAYPTKVDEYKWRSVQALLAVSTDPSAVRLDGGNDLLVVTLEEASKIAQDIQEMLRKESLVSKSSSCQHTSVVVALPQSKR